MESSSSSANPSPQKKVKAKKAERCDDVDDDDGEATQLEMMEYEEIGDEGEDENEEDNDEGKEEDADVDQIDEDTRVQLDESREDQEEEEFVEGQKSALNSSQDQEKESYEFEFARGIESQENVQEEILSQCGGWASGDKVCTAQINMARRFVCIDYPGVIQNQDKAIATLGGLSRISKALSENQRLDLNFRPKDAFCKATTAGFVPTQNLLLKVRRRRRKEFKQGVVSDEADVYEYQVEALGVVEKMYTFDRLCDYQFLPVMRQPDGSFKEILSSIQPNINDDREEYLSRSTPLFLPPFQFTRREVPGKYSFDSDPAIEDEDEKMNLISSERKRRKFGTIQIQFNHPGVPMSPLPDARLNLGKIPKHSKDEGLQSLKKLFEERPLWCKAAVVSKLDASHHRHLKWLLPNVCFYFTSGPWRNLWCRLGYDPRKDPAAKIYQTLDFRVRTVAHRAKVESKRGADVLRQTHFKQQTSGATEHSLDLHDSSESRERKTDDDAALIDTTYIFMPGHPPPYRQMRYQVCDVFLDGIQRLVHENDGKESTCTERDGWCIPDFTDMSRDTLSKEVSEMLEK